MLRRVLSHVIQMMGGPPPGMFMHPPGNGGAWAEEFHGPPGMMMGGGHAWAEEMAMHEAVSAHPPPSASATACATACAHAPYHLRYGLRTCPLAPTLQPTLVPMRRATHMPPAAHATADAPFLTVTT
eukprot:3888402-Rhodomonas_salina.1